MIRRFKRLMVGLRSSWRQRPWLTSGFLLACALTLFFTVNLIASAVYWSTHRDVDLKPWMTVGYIARSWNVPGPEIDKRAGFPGPKEADHPLTLREIADRRGVAVTEVIAEVAKAITQLRAEKIAE